MTIPSSIAVGVLLAGGKSLRMGDGDKCLAPLAGKSLLARAIDRLDPQVGELIINANGDPSRFAQFGLPVVPDTISGFAGPLAGILAGMLWARRHSPKTRFVATVATDTPFFPRNLVACLLSSLDDNDELAVVRCGDQEYPVFGLFPISLAEDLGAFLRETRNRAVMAWIDGHRSKAVAFDPLNNLAVNPFLNINTPDDMAAAELAIESRRMKET